MLNSNSYIPSRYSNPFSTCWTSNLSYVEFCHSVDEVLSRWKNLGHWGAVVGSHGTGKSTLLRALNDRLHALGAEPEWITLRPNLEGSFSVSDARNRILLLEGLERLSFFKQLTLIGQLKRQQCRVLATLHSDSITWPWRLQTVLNTEVSTKLAKHLFNELVSNGSEKLVTWSDALKCWQHGNGDLRELWFDLYELYESRQSDDCQFAEQPTLTIRTVTG